MKKALLLLLLMTVAFSSCKKDDPVIVEYTVSFDSQGGGGLSPVKVPEGSKVTKPGDPVKEGETFLGWYKENTYATVWNFDKDVVTQNLTLYARWAKPEQQVYTVSFETNGGSEVAPLKVIEGDKLVKPSDPTKTDCSFLGWYTDAALTDAWPFETGVVNANMTLYARWSNPEEKIYTISFDTDGGSEIEAVSVVEKEKLMQPTDPTKTGFEFDGWYTDSDRLTAYDFESPVTADITLYAKWTQAIFALVDFEPSVDLEANGITWDEVTHTLDITNATAGSVLKFNVKGVTAIKTSVVSFFNKNASSIGGENSLSNILEDVGSSTGGKIALNVNIPVQTFKVPLDISVMIQNFDNESESETITIKSRPDYAGTGIQPVMMKTTDDKLVFWAPVNVGATKIPESVPSTANTNITESCGKLFQWGRKFGFASTNNTTTTGAEKFDGKTDPLGFPKGEGALANMSPWDKKFIMYSSSNPNSQRNWLLFTEGENNPTDADMEADAWYQKLWNSGTEDNPVKTEYDPCPAGWRVPTFTELKTIGAGTTLPTESWDETNKLLSIAGADTESGQKLILPAAGNRDGEDGASLNQGVSGFYWSSTPSGIKAYIISFKGATLGTLPTNRANGFPVRCVQE